MTKEERLQALNDWNKNTLLQTLDIKFTDVGDDFLVATMPVTPVVHQPLGMLHGGASAALAESLGSCLSNIILDQSVNAAVGTNLNCNHLKSKREGIVTGTARLIRKGRTQHFTEIEIRDEKGDLICHATMTNVVINVR
ncbi:PaaI family thioesterase [Elizabethkingia meningoseptica]|uniref:PaaI family thioesterase n=1 Tax=Elizabethkingia meningoseptica TaxID=238 RepID=UPI003892581B